MLQLVRLNNGFVTAGTNAPGVSCYDVAGPNEEEDQEPYGDVPIMQCLGVSSLPYPPDDTGHAEGILIENVGGLPGIIVAAWDTRTFSIFGNLQGGDTVVHSTGPAKAAQLILKEKKRQSILLSKDTDGKLMLLMLDGKNNKIQVSAWGYVFEISKANGINLDVGSCGMSLHPKNGGTLRGAWTLGGMAPVPGMSMAVAPLATWAALSVLAGPITPIPNAIGAI